MMSPLRSYTDVALLLMRLAIGAVFLYHGLGKWSMEDPSTVMTILKFAEPLGGAALVLGVLTPLASLGLAIIMVGAIYMKASGFGQSAFDLLGTFGQGGRWEFDLVVLVSCLVLIAMGAGKFSVDAKMGK